MACSSQLDMYMDSRESRFQPPRVSGRPTFAAANIILAAGASHPGALHPAGDPLFAAGDHDRVDPDLTPPPPPNTMESGF